VAAIGVTAVIYGLTAAGSHGWRDSRTVGSLACGALLLAVFVRCQRQTPDPLLHPQVVCDRNRGWALGALVMNGLSTFGMMLILTYQLHS
jgi:hypothetical protein